MANTQVSLPEEQVSLARAVELVDVLLETLQRSRDEIAFEDLWTEVKSTCQKCNVSVTVSKKRVNGRIALNCMGA